MNRNEAQVEASEKAREVLDYLVEFNPILRGLMKKLLIEQYLHMYISGVSWAERNELEARREENYCDCEDEYDGHYFREDTNIPQSIVDDLSGVNLDPTKKEKQSE